MGRGKKQTQRQEWETILTYMLDKGLSDVHHVSFRSGLDGECKSQNTGPHELVPEMIYK